MASVTNHDSHLDRAKQFFSDAVREKLEADDTAAGKAVSLILIAIISFGLLSMIVSLWFAL